VTSDHLLFREDGSEAPASSFKPGDRLLGMGEALMGPDQRSLALAQVLGDGSLRQSGPRAQLRVGHGPKQEKYARWKASIFGDLVAWDTGGTHFDLQPSSDLYDVVDGPHLIENERVLAVWCMDDGSFSGHYDRWGWGKFEIACVRWTDEQRSLAADRIHDLIGVRPTPRRRSLLFSGDRTQALMAAIAPFVPDCMAYKIHPRYHEDVGIEAWSSEMYSRRVPVGIAVKSIDEVPSGRQGKRFDITVEGNHNYVVDGAVVHNSPKTTSGGNALKFYASVRIEVTRIGSKSKGDVKVSNTTKAKVVKNKLAPPFRTAEFDIVFGVGIDWAGELIDAAVAKGLISKSGAWYKYNDENVAMGKVNAATWLRENEEVAAELRSKL
jgi:recombination protein RecA